MKSFHFVFTLSAFIVLQQFARAEGPPGQVTKWGMEFGGQPGAIEFARFSTGTVAIAGQVLGNAVAIAAGHSHGLILRSDSTVFGWGWNFFGQATGTKTEHPGITNGIVRTGGRILSNITSIAAGRTHSLGLTKAGTVVAWGASEAGTTQAVANVPPGLSNVIAVSAGWNYNLALKQDGAVVGWGERRIPAGLSNIVAIAAGAGDYAFGLALKKDSTVFQWGPGGLEEPCPAGLSNVISIASGAGHCLALKSDGTVFGWAGNSSGEATGVANRNPPFYSEGPVTINGQILSNVVAIAAGKGYSLALKRDGTVVAWGFNPWRTVNVPGGLSNVVAIAAGENFCLAITTNSAALPGR